MAGESPRPVELPSPAFSPAGAVSFPVIVVSGAFHLVLKEDQLHQMLSSLILGPV
jgi:hypothetical protein